MKHKLLILTRNPVAKVGIASYLSSLFGQYLTIVSTRIADLTPEDMEDAGCILYTAGELKEQMPFSIPDSVKQLVCNAKVCCKTVCADDRGTFYSISSRISADQLYR